MTDRLYASITLTLSVIFMYNLIDDTQVNDTFKSTFNRRLERQMHNEIRRDYEFPPAVCRSMSETFMKYMDLYNGGSRGEGEIIFQAISRKVPPGVPVEEMHLVPVKLRVYSPEDNIICSTRFQKGLLDHRIIRIANDAFSQGALLTQADLAVILGQGTKTVARHIAAMEDSGIVIPTRGKWKDIGPGVSHKKRILELYLKGDQYTDIERKTKHSGEAIMRYVKDFSRVLALNEEDYSTNEIRMISGLSEKTTREYLELINDYSSEEYEDRLDHIRSIFRKKTLKETMQEQRESDRQRRSIE